jgi:hypothetical protein
MCQVLAGEHMWDLAYLCYSERLHTALQRADMHSSLLLLWCSSVLMVALHCPPLIDGRGEKKKKARKKKEKWKKEKRVRFASQHLLAPLPPILFTNRCLLDHAGSQTSSAWGTVLMALQDALL